ncbi:hypothetical protein VUJ46_15210 [Chryseobacterium sp. MYb264]|uniref:hypothetical protein n=1 Tax=Chryseobacterium sp. MYb264 TaxID=2745153 RepID=UPI002E0FC96D|nr:hypothetical protein VUJ46_15210 [Chryseobacterium sp. MYb264]
MNKFFLTLLVGSSTLLFANTEKPKENHPLNDQNNKVLIAKKTIETEETVKKEPITLKKIGNLSSDACYIAMSQVTPPAFPDYSLCAALAEAGY